MKKKNVIQGGKLRLNKTVISALAAEQMEQVKGGQKLTEKTCVSADAGCTATATKK